MQEDNWTKMENKTKVMKPKQKHLIYNTWSIPQFFYEWAHL